MTRSLAPPLLVCALVLPSLLDRIAAEEGGAAPDGSKTQIALRNGFFEINGKPTYPGSTAEGLLLNARMVHAVFEDRNEATCPKDFDADANTASFLKKLPDYVDHGVRAFTINLQGGSPGYEGSLNSAFESDGSLRETYMARVAKVIEACDAAGAAVLLGCFSPQQDQVLADGAAVEKGLENVVDWLAKRGYKNVMLEVADAHTDPGYQHAALRDPNSLAALISKVRKRAPDLLVSASGAPGGRSHPSVSTASSFILLHFHAVPPEAIFARVSSASKLVKAIVCNDDGRTGEAGAKAVAAAVDVLCSWGYANRKLNEEYPFEFKGAEDDPTVYAKFRELTTP